MTHARSLAAALCALAWTGPVAAAEPAGVEFLNSPRAVPGRPFSEAVRHGDTLYLSGQIGAIPGTSKLAPGGLKGEARQVMENIKATLESFGFSMNQIVKCTVMLADMKEWGDFNEVYVTFFPGRYPARSALGANGLALGARVEVECIAAVGKPPG